MIVLKVKKLNNKAKIPRLATDGSACFDLSTAEDVMITSGKFIKIHTGISVEIPVGYCLEIYPRSSVFSRGIIMIDSPIVLDAGYHNEIIIPLYGLFVNRLENFGFGAKIAQARLVKVSPTIIKIVSHLSETERGDGGFGSTGVE